MVARADALAFYEPYGIGRGIVEPFTIAAPAAGANFSRTTAQGYHERYRLINFLLTTSATAANRIVSLEFQDADGNRLGYAAANILQTASLAFRYSFHIGATTTSLATINRQVVALPEVFMQTGWILASVVGAIDATDTITQIRGLVERFGIGPDGTPVGESQLPYTERGRGYARALESE